MSGLLVNRPLKDELSSPDQLLMNCKESATTDGNPFIRAASPKSILHTPKNASETSSTDTVDKSDIHSSSNSDHEAYSQITKPYAEVNTFDILKTSSADVCDTHIRTPHNVKFQMVETSEDSNPNVFTNKSNVDSHTEEDHDSLTDDSSERSSSNYSSNERLDSLETHHLYDSKKLTRETSEGGNEALGEVEEHVVLPSKTHDASTQSGTSDGMSHRMLRYSTRMSGHRKEYHRSVSTCVDLVKLHFSDVETRLFEMFGNKETKTINVKKFLAGLMSTGLRNDDPRLSDLYANVREVKKRNGQGEEESLVVNYNTFMGIIAENLEIVVRAFSHSFIIPEFCSFTERIDDIYYLCRNNTEGHTAEYIPQLTRMNPDFWGVSICTVDGQRHSVGDVKQPFTIQSCSKPLTYAIACADIGPEKMHQYIGHEPSGRFFNELCLDYKNKPHNPMINSGAIMTVALTKPEYSAADRFDYMFEMYKKLAAGEYLGFNNSVFLSEKECADRNFALAYFMRENKCFPPGTKLQETLEFYFQLCSLEITTESGAVIAATLANGGINPLTGDPVLTCEAVRNTLTLMHSCGMYNYSGQFAFKVGLPAKSGVSGCILLVVPNTLGICLWSPALDSNGNSCRGVQFCSELVNLFRFHHFDNLRGNTSLSTKLDPRVTKTESSAQILFDLLFCVAANDISSLRRHALSGTDLESADYDGRTALHVASSEGHGELVEFLLEKCQVNPAPKDRWKRTPLDDARNFRHPSVEKLLIKYSKQRGLVMKNTIDEKLNAEKA